MKMLRAGGQVPTDTLAPASARDLAMANPNPASSATPATSARLPARSIFRIWGISRFEARFTRGKRFAFRERDRTLINLHWETFLFVKPLRIALVCLTLATTAQAQVQDTIGKKTPLFVGKDLILLGAFTAGTALVAPIDMRIANRLQDSATQANRFLHTAATGFRLLGDPGSFATGTVVYLIGRAGGNRRVESVGLHSVESILLADILGGGIKLVAGRQRPYVDVRTPNNPPLWRGWSHDKSRSFPSGHTITAFAF